MIHKNILIGLPATILLLLTFSFSQGQPRFSVGLEAGLSCSGIPRTDEYGLGVSIREKTSPLLRPLAGVWGKMRVKQKFFLVAGTQYNQTGKNIKDITKGYDGINQRYYTSTRKERFRFTKFSFPIVVGYSFSVRKLKCEAFIGFRPNYYISGKYTLKYQHKDNLGLRDTSYQKVIDPFNYARLKYGPARQQKQLMAGVGVMLNNRISVNAFAAALHQIMFYEDSHEIHVYNRPDFVITMKYAFNFERPNASPDNKSKTGKKHD